MTDSLSIAVHAFASRVSMSVLVDETQLPRLVILSTSFRGLPFSVEILFTNPSARAGYDTRSIFKRSLTGLNSEFSFS